MTDASRSEASPEEVERLRAELAEAQARAEELAAYYRGEMEAVRRRADEQATRSEAEAAGRRKRAEEKAARLGEQLESVQREAEQAQRRYEDLRARVNAENAEAAEAQSGRDAELEALRTDYEALRTQLEEERARAREHKLAYDVLRASQKNTEERWRSLMSRLRRGLKLSEQRRKAVEAELREALAAGRARGHGDAEGWSGTGNERHVDPNAGWGETGISLTDDLSEEFLLNEGDRSLMGQAAEGSYSEVESEEAEQLLEGLHVDRRVAQRNADPIPEPIPEHPKDAAGGGSRFTARSPQRARPMPSRGESRGAQRRTPQAPARPRAVSRMGWLAVVACVAAIILVALTLTEL